MAQRNKKRQKIFRLKTHDKFIVDTRVNEKNPLRSIQPDIEWNSGIKKALQLIQLLEKHKQKHGIVTVGLSWNQYMDSQDDPGRVSIVRPSKTDEWIIMVNPYIVYLSDTTHWSQREGCLSAPGKWVNVRRSDKCLVQYIDNKGEEIEKSYDGFMGNVVQHEIDHLDAIFFTDKIRK